MLATALPSRELDGSSLLGHQLGQLTVRLDINQAPILWHLLRFEDILDVQAQLDLRYVYKGLKRLAQTIDPWLGDIHRNELARILTDEEWTNPAARVKTFRMGYNSERSGLSNRNIPWSWQEFAHLPSDAQEKVIEDARRSGVNLT